MKLDSHKNEKQCLSCQFAATFSKKVVFGTSLDLLGSKLPTIDYSTTQEPPSTIPKEKTLL